MIYYVELRDDLHSMPCGMLFPVDTATGTVINQSISPQYVDTWEDETGYVVTL